jgi:hypothetical protein
MQGSSIIREPLLHFFILGGLLFALFAWRNDDAMRAPDEIVVDARRIEALNAQFERVWRRPPTPDEATGLIENWIREEVLYREGLALGLDRDDPVLRRLVAQKVEFISEEMLNTPPTEDELRAWYQENADVYRVEPRFSFRQAYFDPSRRGDMPEAAVGAILQALKEGDAPVGDATLLPEMLEDASLADVRRTFGPLFAESLADLPVGTWTGPVASSYGLHLVRIDERQDARLPAFDEVRAAVERDFGAHRTERLKDAFYETLRDRYTVTIEDAAAAGGAK